MLDSVVVFENLVIHANIFLLTSGIGIFPIKISKLLVGKAIAAILCQRTN